MEGGGRGQGNARQEEGNEGTYPMVGSLYLSKDSVTNLRTMEDLPTPVSPSNTTLTSRALASAMVGSETREVKRRRTPGVNE